MNKRNRTLTNATLELQTARVRRWEKNANDLEISAGIILATAISANEEVLRDLLRQKTKETSDAFEIAIRRLLSRPFVQRVAEGYRLEESFRFGLLRTTEATESSLVWNASNYFLKNELEELDSLSDKNDASWLIEGRIAFYLAAIQPSLSSDEFMSTFEKVPSGFGKAPMTWLADLALRQTVHFGQRNRTVLFFSAFKNYENRKFPYASDQFRSIIDSSTRDDSILAISEHLWAVINETNPRSFAVLERSIQISRKLHIYKNEVMARNSLVFALLGRSGSKRLRIATLREALDLAAYNYRNVSKLSDSYLELVTRKTLAVANWSWLKETNRSILNISIDDVERLVAEHMDIAELNRDKSNYDDMLDALNQALRVRLEMKDLESSMEIVETALDMAIGQYPSRHAQSLAVTVKALSRLKPSSAQSAELKLVIGRLETWISSRDMLQG